MAESRSAKELQQAAAGAGPEQPLPPVEQHALHTAARGGDVAVLDALLARPDAPELVTRRDVHRRTPLHLACWAGHAEAISKLLAAGASANSTAKDGFSALHFAAQKGSAVACQTLLNHGGKPNVWESRKKHTPLHLAALRGHADVVRVLLRHGANPVAKTKAGETPFDLGRQHPSVNAALEAHVAAGVAQRAPPAAAVEETAITAAEPDQGCAAEANDGAEPKPKRRKKDKKAKKRAVMSLDHLEDEEVPF